MVKIVVRDSKGNRIDSMNIIGGRKNFTEEISISLNPNVEYSVELKSKTIQSNSSFSAGTCYFYSEDEVEWTLDGEFGGESTIADINVCYRAVDIMTPKNLLGLWEGFD